jgi:hypothetical protein
MADTRRDTMPDESAPLPPGALPLAYEPTRAELERMRWERMARFGRHGWAARGTGIAGFCGAIVLTIARVIDPAWLGTTHGNGAWVLALGIPALGGAYRVLLAQWDQEAARFGGGHVSLATWRGETDEVEPR